MNKRTTKNSTRKDRQSCREAGRTRISGWLMPVVSHFRAQALVIVVITALGVWLLPRIHLQNDLMYMLPESNPAKQSYIDGEETFGNSGGIAITITSEAGIYQTELIERVRAFSKRCREMNIRIPARQLATKLNLGSDESLALAGALQSLSSDPDYGAEQLFEILSDLDTLAETLSDALPPFLDMADPDIFAEGLAESMVTRTARHPELARELYTFSRQTTDRNGRFRSVWVDQVVSLTETTTVWPEFADHSAIARDMAPLGFPPGPELNRLADMLLESGRTQGDAILAMKTAVAESEEFSAPFRELLNTRLTAAAAGTLARAMAEAPKQIRVADLVPEEITPATLGCIRERLHAWPFFQKGLYSPDEKSLLVVIRTTPNLDQPNRARLLKAVKEELQVRFGDGHYQTRIAGHSVVDEAVSDRMLQDIKRLLPLVIVVVVVFLVLSFRSLSGVLYPMLTVILAVIWCIACMSLFDVPLSLVSMALPVVLVAVGSAYGIHIVHYFTHNRANWAGNRPATIDTLDGAGLGVIMAGLTTVAGFGSLAFNDIVALRDFGLFIAIGVSFALVVSLTLVVSLLDRFGVRPSIARPSRTTAVCGHRFRNIMGALSRLTTRRPKTVLILAGALLVGAIACLPGLHVEMNNITFFKKSSDIRRADAFINREFAGTVDIRVIFSAAADTGALDPVVLDTMQRLECALLERHEEIGKTLSVVDLICKMNQAFYFNDPAHYKIPRKTDIAGAQTDAALRAHLVSYVDKYPRSDIRPFIDPAKRKAVLILQINTASSAVSRKIMHSVDDLLNGPLGDDLRRNQVDVHTTGNAALYTETEHLIVHGQLRSIAVSIVIVLVLVALIMRSVFFGLLAITPLIVTLLVNFAIMGLLGIPLDPATAIIACVAIGIGVDYGVHYLNRYRLFRSTGAGHMAAVKATSETTGGAILINAITVAAGFSVLTLSAFVPLMYVGFLMALTMVVAALGALTVLPAALTLFNPTDQTDIRPEEEATHENQPCTR